MTAPRRPLAEIAAEIANLRDLMGRGLVTELMWARPDRSALNTTLLAAGAHDVELVVVDDAPTTALRLRELNRARDTMLPAGRTILFLVRDGAGARVVRRECPDLTAVFDLTAEVGEQHRLPFDVLVDRVRAAQLGRYEEIDLTGLVANTVDHVGIRLDEVFERSAALPELKDGLRARPWLVVGAPGTGKTTSLRFVAWADAASVDTGVDLEGRLPIVVPMALWAASSRDREISLRAFLERFVGALIGLDEVALDEHLCRLALLFDGLDEVTAASARRVILLAAAALHEAGAAVVITAREHTVDELDAAAARTWGVRRIAPIPDEAWRPFVGRLLRARGARSEAELTARAAAIVAHAEFPTFAHSPLLLTFLVVLAEVQGSMPSQRVELYRDLVEMMITSWRRLRDPSRGRSIHRGEVLRVVAPLGWHLVREGLGGLTERELEGVLIALERERDPDYALGAVRDRLALLREDTALLRTSDGLWRFNHPSIAEYLAACAVLQDDRKLDVLCEDPYNPAMTQVLAFVLAFVTDIEPRDAVASRLLTALTQRSRRAGVYDAKVPRTIAVCLTEARDLPASAQLDLAHRALQIALTNKLTPLRRLEAAWAIRTLLASHAAPIRRAIAAWLAPPDETIDWRRFADGLLFGADIDELPDWLSNAGYDPGPLLKTWLDHADPRVRALALGAWGAQHDGSLRAIRARWAVIRAHDPGVADLPWGAGWTITTDKPIDRSPWIEARYPGISAKLAASTSLDPTLKPAESPPA